MINLMPIHEQKEIRAARANSLLMRYSILMLIATLFVLAALAFTYLSLTAIGRAADKEKIENQQKASGLVQTQVEAEKLRNDLMSAKNLFDNEIKYSLIVTRITNLLPAGAAIDALHIETSTFDQPKTLSVQIKNREAAEELEKNFKASPYLKDVSLGSISTNSESNAYPYIAEITFTLDRSISQ